MGKEMNIVTAEVTNTIGFYKLFELNNNMF